MNSPRKTPLQSPPTITVDGVKLRTLRLSHALTQLQLARRAGVARITVSRMEAGGHVCSPQSVSLIAAALGVIPLDFVVVALTGWVL